MAGLASFFSSLATRRATGRVVAIGVGAGYELLLAARILHGWQIEAYEIDEAMRNRARGLWSFFNVDAVKELGVMFPLERFDPDVTRSYDGVVMCELCEHLRDPFEALTNVRKYLKDDGQAFVTMAINIAQEDHVFLYPTIDACRVQLQTAGFQILWEWLAPQVLNPPRERQKSFRKGNYVAVVHK